jgi:Zn-finger protein
MGNNNHFTPTCAHCDDPITTDQLCFEDKTNDNYYHRDCYHDTHTHECTHCGDGINLNTDTAIPTKTGYYHQSCHFDANAKEHCNNCNQGLVPGQNLRRITNDNGTNTYLCIDCWSTEMTENARELLEHLENQFDATHEPSQAEQKRLNLYKTPDGWKQDDRE